MHTRKTREDFPSSGIPHTHLRCTWQAVIQRIQVYYSPIQSTMGSGINDMACKALAYYPISLLCDVLQ